MKTLEDLQNNHCGMNIASIFDLKYEAMKWIKELKSDDNNKNVISWIKTFFNLKEEKESDKITHPRIKEFVEKMIAGNYNQATSYAFEMGLRSDVKDAIQKATENRTNEIFDELDKIEEFYITLPKTYFEDVERLKQKFGVKK